MRAVIDSAQLDQLSETQVCALAARLFTEVRHKQATIEKLTHETAVLKRLKFAARSEAFNAEQKSLLEEAIDEDLEAIGRELERERPIAPPAPKEQPKRQPLPANLPRREIRHEPDSTTCRCGCQPKRIGEDVAEKLDYVPGVFTVERHVRGKWVCAACQTRVQAPVPAHVIHKGLPTTGLLAWVLVAKYADHLPPVPAGSDLRAGRLGAVALDPGAVGRRLRRRAAAAGRRPEGRDAHPAGAARRRNPGGDARARARQDAPGHFVERWRDGVRSAQGGGLRLRRDPRRAACANVLRAGH